MRLIVSLSPETAAEIRRLRAEAETLRTQHGETSDARAAYRLAAKQLERQARQLENPKR